MKQLTGSGPWGRMLRGALVVAFVTLSWTYVLGGWDGLSRFWWLMLFVAFLTVFGVVATSWATRMEYHYKKLREEKERA